MKRKKRSNTMGVNLKGRNFLTLMDFTPEEIRYMLDLGHDLLFAFSSMLD